MPFSIEEVGIMLDDALTEAIEIVERAVAELIESGRWGLGIAVDSSQKNESS